MVVYRHLAVIQAWCSSDIVSVFSAYYLTIHHPACCSANCSTSSREAPDSQYKFDISWLSKCIHGQPSPITSSETTLEHLIMHTYIHTTHPNNPPSENPGYGPAIHDTCQMQVCIANTNLWRLWQRSWVTVLKKTHPEVKILRLSLYKSLSCLLLKCLPWTRTARSNDGHASYFAEAPCFLDPQRWSSAAYRSNIGSISPPCVLR